MRRRSAVSRRNFTVTSANLKRSTGKRRQVIESEVPAWVGLRWPMTQADFIFATAKTRVFTLRLPNSHNLRSHQKIRHAEYQGEGVTITTVRKSRATTNANQSSSYVVPSHSQTSSSLIISPPPPPNLLNLNASDTKINLSLFKAE